MALPKPLQEFCNETAEAPLRMGTEGHGEDVFETDKTVLLVRRPIDGFLAAQRHTSLDDGKVDGATRMTLPEPLQEFCNETGEAPLQMGTEDMARTCSKQTRRCSSGATPSMASSRPSAM
eukprot:NODE_3115_length_828_cov_239.285899.p3 GENE.NODE_3115_length_828_cov_239.285899~~NODE_3115_length_828_cov_239.285899.p3  ORF type:complete len:120 (-),score=31.83 NODE_3115_length_828_cov_239.285899:408-767(-)